MENNYANKNAQAVLNKVNEYIEKLEYTKKYQGERKTLSIRKVFDDLSIFDWWKNDLSLSNLYDMQKFLKEAIDLGFKGYVCFKVGVSGCSNGMWAHSEETTNGFSPNSDFLYKSFSPSYKVLSIQIDQ